MNTKFFNDAEAQRITALAGFLRINPGHVTGEIFAEFDAKPEIESEFARDVEASLELEPENALIWSVGYLTLIAPGWRDALNPQNPTGSSARRTYLRAINGGGEA